MPKPISNGLSGWKLWNHDLLRNIEQREREKHMDKTPEHTLQRTLAEEALPRIRVLGLTKVYRRGGEPVQALAGIGLEIAPGAFVAIMGQSGSGKTTLLNMLTGVDRPTAGEIWLDGQRLDTQSEAKLAILRRRRIGLIFQAFNLLNNMSAMENVMLPALLAGRSASEARTLAIMLLDELGLSKRLQKLPGQLSGGEQQRVAIARALVNEPVVLCADEPTGNVDAHTGQEILHLLKRLHAQGQTIILVTHDAQIASQAERIIIMRDGCIIDEANGQGKLPAPPALLADMSGLDIG
jgi:putative ABC transport system ATP-binding protein